MRHLVLTHEGAPMLTSITAGPIKKRILEWSDDDADLRQVWSVPADDSMTPAQDITEQFAQTWAMELRGQPIPAFVRHATREIDLPNPLWRVA